jgi:hypothetical protein
VRFTAGRQIELRRAPRRDALEAAGFTLQPLPRRKATADAANHNQATGIANRQRSKHDAVDEGKDGGVGADAQRQCQHRDERQSRVARQQADAVANVASDVDQPHRPSRLVVPLRGRSDVAKRTPGGVTRRRPRQTVRDQPIRFEGDVRLDLALKVVLTA